jgi:hypothetical protein
MLKVYLSVQHNRMHQFQFVKVCAQFQLYVMLVQMKQVRKLFWVKE